MKLNSKLTELAKKAASAEEAVKLAAENGYSVTLEEAEKYMSFLKGNGPMADDELEAIAGGMDGKGSKDPAPKYYVGQHLWIAFSATHNYLEVEVKAQLSYDQGRGWYYCVRVLENGQNYYEHLDECRVYTSDPTRG